MELNKIFEITSSNKSDDSKIEALLQQCSKRICVEFAYKVCLDIKHLMEDERSLIAIEAIKQYLDTGKPVSREIIDSASAAAYAVRTAYASASWVASYAASAASYTVYTSSYAVYAIYAATASAASIASAAASSAAASTSSILEKDKQYLQLLIELIASSCSCEENKFLHEIMLCTS